MKQTCHLLLPFFILSVGCLHAQVSPYYQPAQGLAGEQLFTALHDIIDNHTVLPYTSSSTDVWDALKVTDRDSVNPQNVILLYSGRSVDAAQEFNSGNGWTREHVWAKSRGDFGTNTPAGTDIHHLRPLDASVNSVRNNRNFDDCISCEAVIDNGFVTGSFTDANQWTFEPPDEMKGDVARMIFYMAVRYEGDASNEVDLVLTENHLTRQSKAPMHATLSTLLQWHESDPVSDWERNRNEVIFTQFQQNRNPFIDYPDLANHLWGELKTTPWPNPARVPSLSEDAQFKVWPNPVSETLRFSEVIERVQLYDESGRLILEGSNISTLETGTLKPGFLPAYWNSKRPDYQT